MLHGLGGSKADFEGTSPAGHYDNVFYARRGYAVVNYTARGYGRSCGPTVPHVGACARGWTHLADQRYEVRDTQHLLGALVDEGVARAGALGVTGVSYGGGQVQSLAPLRDRVRLRNGRLVRWRSPAGRPLRIGAAFSVIGWSDLTYALVPNGRFLDFEDPPVAESRRPPGIEKQSYLNGLYLVNQLRSYLAPPGADPTGDLTTWRQISNAGEPFRADAVRVARELSAFHSAAGLGRVTAPLLLQSGFTDDLFPPEESLRVYRTFRRLPRAYVALQLGDLGHPRGGNKPNTRLYFNDQGARFFDALLRHRGRAPRNRSVTAFTLTCPKGAPGGGPYRAGSWRRLHPGAFRLGGRRAQRVSSAGGNPATAAAFDQVVSGDPCLTVPRDRAAGTAVYERRVRHSFLMLGLPTVRASIRTTGPFGELAIRLWDVADGRQRLISRGAYRLRNGQRGRITFQLSGNGWLLRRGHVVKLELLGRDPHFLRPSNGTFSVRVGRLAIELPTHEGPSRRRGISRPRLAP
jgi:X-Pro dipeptidyl-peptidase (S15 family)